MLRPRVGKWALAAITLVIVGVPLPARAATLAKPTLSQRVSRQEAQIRQQKAEIDSQQTAIEAQRGLIERQAAAADSQSALLATQRATLDTLLGRLEEMRRRLDQLESQAGLPAWQSQFEERLKQIEAAKGKTPELPPDVVSAGDFPGSIRIPGSDAAIKFGALIRTAAVLTLDPLGTDDRFLTNSIPVGAVTSGEDKRTNISARASQLNFELRSPAGRSQVRTFIEGDFAGTTNAFRLRHAYAQYSGFIVGQTWSTFSDPEAKPEDLDFEGISSENVIRQPLIRYFWRPVPNTRAAVALETPSVSITGGQGVNLFPDVIARAFIGQSDGKHVQLAGVARQIRGQVASGKVETVWGGGGSVSGVDKFRVLGLTDRVTFQVNGGIGIARYINDLNSLGGQDAVVDTVAAKLEPIPALGWYVAYEHAWKEWAAAEDLHLRSTLLWSFVTVDNLDIQPPDAYAKTHRLAANLVFSAANRVDVGVEYIYGTRTNKDGQSGHANQIQVVGLFRF